MISKKMVMNNAVFGKIMENVRKYRDIKLITTEERMIYLKKFFYLLAIEMKKNKPVYIGLSMLEISKIVMYEFWCDYVKPK